MSSYPESLAVHDLRTGALHGNQILHHPVKFRPILFFHPELIVSFAGPSSEWLEIYGSSAGLDRPPDNFRQAPEVQRYDGRLDDDGEADVLFFLFLSNSAMPSVILRKSLFMPLTCRELPRLGITGDIEVERFCRHVPGVEQGAVGGDT